MSEQDVTPWIDYASVSIETARRVWSRMAILSFCGAVFSLLLLPFLYLPFITGRGPAPVTAVLLPLATIMFAAWAIVSTHRIRRAVRGRSLAVMAFVLTVPVSLPATIYVTDEVQDRRAASVSEAQSTLTLNGAWSPPAAAKVVYARLEGFSSLSGAWYLIEMPPSAIPSYRNAVLSTSGRPSASNRSGDNLGLMLSSSSSVAPSWWNPESLPDADALRFDASTGYSSTIYVLSASRGLVYVYWGA